LHPYLLQQLKRGKDIDKKRDNKGTKKTHLTLIVAEMHAFFGVH
jgi:hypothetical protein